MRAFLIEVLYTQYKNMNSLKQNHVAECLNTFKVEIDNLATLLKLIGYPQNKDIIEQSIIEVCPLNHRQEVYHCFFDRLDFYLEPNTKLSKKARKQDIDNCLKTVCNDLREYNKLNNIKSTKYLNQLLKQYDKLDKEIDDEYDDSDLGFVCDEIFKNGF